MHYLRSFLLLLLLIITVKSSFATSSLDSLSSYFDKLKYELSKSHSLDSIKQPYIDSINHSLFLTLSHKDGFNTPFTGINGINSIYTGDSLLRIVQWLIPMDSGIKHFMYLLKRRHIKGVHYTHFYPSSPAFDFSTIDTATITPSNWYGSAYSKIQKLKIGTRDIYFLIGYSMPTPLYRMRVLEPLTFSGDKLIFGYNCFFNARRNKRFTLKYAAVAKNITLDYSLEHHAFIFDAMLPLTPEAVGKPEFTYPSEGFSAYEYVESDKKLIYHNSFDVRVPTERVNELRMIKRKTPPKF